MKTIVSLVAVCVLCAATGVAKAQESNPFDSLFAKPPVTTPVATSLTVEGIKDQLVNLGYDAEMKSLGTVNYIQITLKHSDGERRHMVAIEPGTRNIFVTGGGFSRSPDVKQASTAWYRRLAKVNNAMSPRMIFINDNDVLGMTSTLANSNVTADDLEKLLKDHVAQFDGQLIPLAAELPTQVPVASR